MGVDKSPEKVQEEIANINYRNSGKEVAFNPQTGELEVLDKQSDVAPNSTAITDVADDGFAGTDRRPEKVQEEIANINYGSSGKEVAFNPQTGELEVLDRQSDVAPNATMITEVVDDGFANAPIVYAYEEEVVEFLKKSGEPLKRGIAFEWKGEDVYHVHIETPKIPVSGRPCMSFFAYVGRENFILDKAKLVDKLGITTYFKDSNFYNKAILCVFFYNGSIVQKSAILLSDNSIEECNFKYVPKKSELYSRAKGLLEVDMLEKKTVAIIGLGSFGSNISIELAKAGIGNFKLFDFDRVELSNISRHTCGINDLGRYKTHAIRDAILQKNPFANVSTFEININEHPDLLLSEVKDVDIILCLTDENQSRSRLNALAIEHKKKIIYGRAITRAEGGDVFRYIPCENKPCLACLIGKGLFNFQQEEVTSERQANRDLPAYTSAESRAAAIQVGLSSDILPICNMIVKLTLVELSKGLNCGLSSLEEDLVADYYIWANRRENKYKNFPKMEYKANQLSILRWYGVRVNKDEYCLSCNCLTL
jgi:molybdopterin/thiamine biosynthesis adenylyltransferase